MFALAELPLIGYAIEPDVAQVRVKSFQTWPSAHGTTIGIWVAAVLGVY